MNIEEDHNLKNIHLSISCWNLKVNMYSTQACKKTNTHILFYVTCFPVFETLCYVSEVRRHISLFHKLVFSSLNIYMHVTICKAFNTQHGTGLWNYSHINKPTHASPNPTHREIGTSMALPYRMVCCGLVDIINWFHYGHSQINPNNCYEIWYKDTIARKKIALHTQGTIDP